MNRVERGFTIIEVMLFFAISAGLLVIAMQAMGSTITRTRGDDARNNLVSFIQKQYNNVATNNVTRPLKPNEKVTCYPNNPANAFDNPPFTVANGTAKAGESDSCVVVGVVISFFVSGSTPRTQANVYPVLAYSTPHPDTSSNGGLFRNNLEVWYDKAPGGPFFPVDHKIDSYTLTWGAEVSDVKIAQMNSTFSANPSMDLKTGFAFIRNPVSQSIDIVALDNWFGGPGNIGSSLFTDWNIEAANIGDKVRTRRGVPGLICLKYDGSDRRDAILFQGDGKKTGFSLNDISTVVGQKGDAYTFGGIVGGGGLTCAN